MSNNDFAHVNSPHSEDDRVSAREELSIDVRNNSQIPFFEKKKGNLIKYSKNDDNVLLEILPNVSYLKKTI